MSVISIKANCSDADGFVSKVEFFIDDVLASTDDTIPYSFDWNTTGFSLGSYLLITKVTDNAKAVNSDTVVVFVGYAPIVQITSPVSGQFINPGDTVKIQANATSTNGKSKNVSRVDFYVNNIFRESDTVIPYEYSWATAGIEDGDYKIKTVVTDSLGVSNEDSVSVILDKSPNISVTSPTNEQIFYPGNTIRIRATASDTKGKNRSVAKVEFYIDGIKKNTDAVQPYDYSWVISGIMDGNHIVKAVAIDNLGSSNADSVNITVPIPVMLLLNGGTFQMGDASISNTIPLHSVTISPFYMGKYEVTQSEWIATMGNNPSHLIGDLNCPVENISWYDVLVYCNKRSIAESLTPCYSIGGSTLPTGSTGSTWGPVPTAVSSTWNDVVCNWNANGYRMPTEAEWEFASRGGISSGQYIYSGSNNIDLVAWYVTNSGGKTHKIGNKTPNELGVYDMSGNVLEWVWDWYGNYLETDQTNPTGSTTGTTRILRGGSYMYDLNYCRVAFRNNNNPYNKYDGMGLRLVRGL